MWKLAHQAPQVQIKSRILLSYKNTLNLTIRWWGFLIYWALFQVKNIPQQIDLLNPPKSHFSLILLSIFAGNSD